MGGFCRSINYTEFESLPSESKARDDAFSAEIQARMESIKAEGKEMRESMQKEFDEFRKVMLDRTHEYIVIFGMLLLTASITLLGYSILK
jgi:hypothetical protein